MADRPTIWRAGRDRVAHAFVHRSPRTLCGERVIPENLAWPHLTVCAVCKARLEDAA